MADNTNMNEAMGWDDSIENEGQEFILLDEGDYEFTVEKMERGQFNGSAKLSFPEGHADPRCCYRQGNRSRQD